jgi:hypothetical protein
MAFGYDADAAYEMQINANRREDLAQQEYELKQMMLGQARGGTAGGMQTNAYGGPISSGSSSGGSFSSSLPTVTSVPSGPGGMPVAPSVNASPNLQSMSEQLRYDPWAANRTQAGTQLAGQMGQTSPSGVYQDKLAQMANGTFSPDDPSYQWRFQQGQQAAERSLAARGLLNSGNAAIELQQYGQGAASQEYGAQFNRMLQGLAGTESAYDTQMQRLMKMAGVDANPVAGGQLNVAQEQTGIDRGRLGLASQELTNQYDLGYRNLGIQSQELAIKQQMANNSNSAAQWGALFGNSGGGGTPQQTSSWDDYFAAKDAAGAARSAYGYPDTSLSAF